MEAETKVKLKNLILHKNDHFLRFETNPLGQLVFGTLKRAIIIWDNVCGVCYESGI